MKRVVLTVFATGIIVFSACGQKLKESEVPSAAKTAFEKKYPGIKGSWDKEDANYEVNFKKDNKSMSAVIDKSGSVVETETDMAVNDLPPAIKDYMKKHYPNAKITEAAQIEKASGEKNYEAEVNHKDVIF